MVIALTLAVTSAALPVIAATAAAPEWQSTQPVLSCNAPMIGSCHGRTATLLEGPQCRANPARSFCGEVLLVGSLQEVAGAQDARAADLYDPRTGAWTAAAQTLQIRSNPGAVQLDGAQCAANPTAGACGKVLVVGGNQNDVPDTAELYDPATHTWSWAHPLLFSHYVWFTMVLLQGPRCDSLCGDVLVAAGGGADGDKAEIYDPIRDSWTATGAMIQRRSEHVSVLLDGPACATSPAPGYCGDVLVAGGRVGNPSSLTTSTAEIFDPAATDGSTGARGAWRPTASLAPDGPVPYAPELAGAAQLAGPRCAQHCGQALVAGGVGVTAAGNPEYGTSELYDPARGTWALTAPMAHPRDSYASVLLSTGDYLAAGGSGAGGSTAELYDPSGNGAWTSADAMPQGGYDYATAVLASGPSSVCGTLCGRAIVTGGGMVDADLFEGPPAIGAVSTDPVPLEGGSVVLTGGAFTTIDTVTIDGSPIACPSVACSHDQSSPDTTLDVIAPAHAAGTATLVVHNEIGDSPPFLVRYAVLPPHLTAVSPSCGPLTGGSVVTLSGDHFTAGSLVEVAGRQTPASVRSATAIQIVSPPASQPTSADVTVTTDGGSSSPLTFTYPCAQTGMSQSVSEVGFAAPGPSTGAPPPAHPGPPAVQAPPASAPIAAPHAPAAASLQGPASAPATAPPPAQPIAGVARDETEGSAALGFRMVSRSDWDPSPALIGTGAVMLLAFCGCLAVARGGQARGRRAGGAAVATIHVGEAEVELQ